MNDNCREALDELVDRWWAFADRHPIVAGVIIFGFFLAGVAVERRRRLAREWIGG